MKVEISNRATRALSKRKEPLYVELELYFSCYIRKRVLFLSEPSLEGMDMESPTDKLRLQFRPVMTKACKVSESRVDPELETFPIARPEEFKPKHLFLDYKRGKWIGEYSLRS